MTPTERREQLATGWRALKDACRATHKGGPGAAAQCVCGAGSGRSEACGMLGTLRDLVRYIPTEGLPKELAEHLEMLRSVV